MSLAKRATAEALGTAFLLATVVGSGIMAQNLAGGNTALALLANTLATFTVTRTSKTFLGHPTRAATG